MSNNPPEPCDDDVIDQIADERGIEPEQVTDEMIQEYIDDARFDFEERDADEGL